MLSNAYFLAKIRFDTAENEPAKNLQKFARILLIVLTLTPKVLDGNPCLEDYQARVARIVGKLNLSLETKTKAALLRWH